MEQIGAHRRSCDAGDERHRRRLLASEQQLIAAAMGAGTSPGSAMPTPAPAGP
jgi:hypothetical protein